MAACNRYKLILYSAATCNLNCSYCYIDKNPALVKIDEILEESFKGDYYFKFAKEMFPNKEQLSSVEIWGGEPTLSLHRTYHVIEELAGYYPNLNTVFHSTNATPVGWIDEIGGMVKTLQSCSDREWTYSIQISLDGPAYINDTNRGSGVTEKVTNNMKSLFEHINKWLDIPNNNVRISMVFKQTLTLKWVQELIKDKKFIIDYYQFFESFLDMFRNTIKFGVMADFQPGVPNLAQPCPATSYDGVCLKEFSHLCNEIMQENETMHYFKYYKSILMFTPMRCEVDYDNLSYTKNCGACGSGYSNIGLLPYDFVSTCHNGFVGLVSDYKAKSMSIKEHDILDFRLFMNESNDMICKKTDYAEYERKVDFAYNNASKSKLANISTMVMWAALAGQIDEKYKEPEEALRGAIFISNVTSYCMRDNKTTTGSLSLYPIGNIRLFLNGAREEIEHGIVSGRK